VVVGESRTVLAVLGRRDRRLSEALSLHIPNGAVPGPGGLLGLELEFSLRSLRGDRVHFGSLLHRLALDGALLDPGDPNAYRCSWGGVVTSDGAEAEIATPPVLTRPGFTGQLHAWARTGEAELRRAVPGGIELYGYSAHVSAAMPAKLNDRVCRLYAQTFAADLMLLMDRIDSPGLLVRPRPGRTELCGEFIDDEPLAAAAAFVAGSIRACAAAVRRPSARAPLPPRLDVRLARAVHRYGWYVDRAAFGFDLHAVSRRALLPRTSGGTICAQSHLELAWAAARQALGQDAAVEDLQAAEAMVSGSRPLPAEQGQSSCAPGSERSGDVWFPRTATLVPTAPRLCSHVRPGFTIRPVAATWDFTVFEACGSTRRAYACIPRDSLPGFVGALEEGALDDAIVAYLAHSSHGRMLSAHQQTTRAGLYDMMGAPAELLAPERDPQTGRRESSERGAKHTLVRPGKRHRNGREAVPREPSRICPRAAAIGVATAVALAGAGVAAAVLIGGHNGQNGSAHMSFEPPALSFPTVSVNARSTRSVTLTNNGSSPATITRIRISGPARHDFSLAASLLGAAKRVGQAVPPATQEQACNGRVLHAQTCTITVVFTPSAPGSRTADLRIYFAAPLRPRDIALSGTGSIGPPPHVSVTDVSPASGPAAGGTPVTITGTGFTGATGVSFGGTAGTGVTVADSGTRITVTSPAGSGTVDVTVSTAAGGTSATSRADRFTYTAAPTVTGVSPPSGPAAGGTPVTITGTGFTAATGVSFGGTAGTGVTVADSGTRITVTSPAGSGTVDVTVTTAAGGTSATSRADRFTYTAAPTVTGVSPACGSAAGKDRVIVTGTGFTGATGVSFGGTAGTGVTVADSGTQITVTSPPGSGTVDVTVTTAAGDTSATSPADQFTYNGCSIVPR
jgi:hypothetical protein